MAEPPATHYSALFQPLADCKPLEVRGYAAILTSTLDALKEQIGRHYSPSLRSSDHPAHITLLTKDELRLYRCCPSKKTTPWQDIDVSKVYLLPPTQHGDVWFMPVLWNAGNRWRTENGLPYKDFHVTLSSKDVHDIDKSVDTLRWKEKDDDGQGWRCVDELWLPSDLDVVVWDQLYEDFFKRDVEDTRLLCWLENMAETFPEQDRAWCRLADLALSRDSWKLAMLAYRVALARAGDDDGRRRKYYVKKLVLCGEHVQFGPVFLEEEKALVQATVTSKYVRKVLYERWGDETTPLAQEIREASVVESRSEYFTPIVSESGTNWHKLPRFFSWISPFRVAGMSTPNSSADIIALRELGITNVITLTFEGPLPTEWFSNGIRNTFIPVANYYPPTIQQMDFALRLVATEPLGVGGSSLVHCGGGKGRAGTVLACYLALFGLEEPNLDENVPPKMTATDAIALLRRLRPGSVETERQEKFIKEYVSLAWERFGAGDALFGGGGEVDEPAGLPVEITGDIKDPDVVVLIGVQGSGKSSFVKLAKIRNQNITVLSPDEIIKESDGASGSGDATRACEAAMGRFRKGMKKVLLLDRCNPTAEERKYWISLLTMNAKVVAVFFDFEKELCKSRAEARTAHPSMPPWRAKGAIESMSKLLTPPTLSEGFSGIAKVPSIDASRNLATTLFGSLFMRKFLRTRHLLDLGAATRDDLVLTASDLASYTDQHVLVEEKIDGANLGFSLSSENKILTQNRSHYVSHTDQAQFGPLPAWLEANSAAVRKVLMGDEVVPERWILFGEWMVAKHSIHYTHLPGYFIAFDMYDRLEDVYVPRKELERRLGGSGIPIVPKVFEGTLEGPEMLKGFLQVKSVFTDGLVEGVVVRFRNGERGKVVRSDFIAGDKHWSKNVMVKNELALGKE